MVTLQVLQAQCLRPSIWTKYTTSNTVFCSIYAVKQWIICFDMGCNARIVVRREYNQLSQDLGWKLWNDRHPLQYAIVALCAQVRIPMQTEQKIQQKYPTILCCNGLKVILRQESVWGRNVRNFFSFFNSISLSILMRVAFWLAYRWVCDCEDRIFWSSKENVGKSTAHCSCCMEHKPQRIPL